MIKQAEHKRQHFSYRSLTFFNNFFHVFKNKSLQSISRGYNEMQIAFA